MSAAAIATAAARAALDDRKPQGTEAGLALLAACLMRVQAGRESLCASLLAECSAEDLRATTVHKDSAFIYAANRGMVSLLEVFVEKGQDINVTDDEGLHGAPLGGSQQSAR